MGNNLSAVMLLMGAGMAQEVKDCGNIRVLGFYLQDTTGSFTSILGPGRAFDTEVGKFMDKVDSVYPGSMFGVYSYSDRQYNNIDTTMRGDGDFVKLTALADIATAKSKVSQVVIKDGGGTNSGAFDVMFHLTVNETDSGLDKLTPLADTYDAKVMYVFTDGIPDYLESFNDDCLPPEGTGYGCAYLCGMSKSMHCCDYDSSTGVYTPLTSKCSHAPKWNPTASCPIDLGSLGKNINDDDWYVVYIAVAKKADNVYKWEKQVPLMGIESRFASYGVNYQYDGLADALVNVTSQIMCSAVPSNNPSGLPTGGPTNPPTVAPSTAGPTTAPSTGGLTTAPTTSGPTHNSRPWPAVHLLV